MKVIIHPHSRVIFHKLIYNLVPNEKKEYDVVRWDTDSHIKISVDAVVAISLLSYGRTVAQVADTIGISSKRVADLVLKLVDAGFIQQVDEISISDTSPKITPWFSGISRKWFQWVLSKYVLFGGILVIVFGFSVGILDKGYFPSYQDFFWNSDYLIVFLSLFVIDAFLLLIHEFSHFVATKAVGGEARIRLDHRFIYVVAETESYHLGIIPQQLRYAIYLAGIFVDLLIIAGIFLFFKAAEIFLWHLEFLFPFFKVIILLEIIKIAWQFNIFIETDIYNFLSDYLNQENLRTDAKKDMRLKLKKWKGKLLFPVKWLLLQLYEDKESRYADDFRYLQKYERKQILVYSGILIVGLLIVIAQVIFLTVPRDVSFIFYGMDNIVSGLKTGNMISVGRGVLLFLLLIVHYLILVVIIIKNKQKQVSQESIIED